MPDLVGLACAFAYVVLMAGVNVALRSLSERLSPSLIIGLRAVIGTFFIVPIALLTAPEDYALLTPQRLLYLCGSIIIGGLWGSTLNVIAMRRLGVSRAVPITNTRPLCAMLFAYLILGESLRWTMLPGTLLVILGVWLITIPQDGYDHEPLSRRDLWIGVAMAVVTAFLWGITGVVLSLGLEGINGVVASSVRIPVVAVFSMIAAASRGQLHEIRRIDGRAALMLLLLGTLGYGVLSTLYVMSVQRLGPSLPQIIGNLTPLFTLPLGVLFLGERPGRCTVLGAVVAVTGTVVVLVL